ncbi:MAG: endonuclease, partial [Deltaproteobacteria bacterium]|nr:endonuclease [Deltaproteobacteria bacterium]
IRGRSYRTTPIPFIVENHAPLHNNQEKATHSIRKSTPRHHLKKNRKLFKAWDIEHPVDSWECERRRRIEKIQGNENPFIKKNCQEQGIW